MSNGSSSEELRVLFQVFIADIRYTKQQQWNTTYLTLIALAGIITLSLWLASEHELSQIMPSWLNCFLIIISIIISFFGLFCVNSYQCDLKKYRSKKTKVAKKLAETSEIIRDILEISEKEKDDYSFVLLFWVTILLAEVLTVILVVLADLI